jgi:hypothetical protein
VALRNDSARPPGGRPVPEVKRGLVLWLSGADPAILAKCPSERGKFIGIGGVILTTATMAAVSAAFALIIGARAHPAVAVAVGLFWGLAIMNLDRWLVSSTARRERWYQNLAVATPRLVLALIIGLVISTPLVLWIFQREIESHLNVMIEQKSKAFQEQLAQNPRLGQIGPLETQAAELQGRINGTIPLTANTDLDRLRTQRDSSKAAYDQAVADALAEWEGRGPSGRQGNGPIWQQKKAIEESRKIEYDKAEQSYQTSLATAKSSLQTELTAKQEELATYTKERDDQTAVFEEDNKDDRGLLARLSALSGLTDSSGTLKGAYIALLLFITVIEILPVLVKFLMSLGPPSLYDEVLAASQKTNIETARAKLTHEHETILRDLEIRRMKENEIAEEVISQEIQAEQDWRNERMTNATAAPAQTVKPPKRRGWGQSKPTADHDGYALWPDPE